MSASRGAFLIPLSQFRILEKPAMILATSAILTTILLNFKFNALEARLYDLRISLSESQPPSKDIVLITLDDQTTEAAREVPPLSLDQHVKLLEKLESASPRAVGYLVNMNYVNQVDPDLFEQEWGERFVDSVRRLEQGGTPVILGTPFDINGEVLPPYPLSGLEHSIAIIHRDGNVFAGDKITRRALVELYGRPAFHLELARAIGKLDSNQRPKGVFQVAEADGSYFFFRYPKASEASDPFAYDHYSFIDVLNGKMSPSVFKNKIVLVGTYSRQNPAESTLSPHFLAGRISPKLDVHAAILDSMVRDDGIVLAPSWINALITFAFIFFVVWTVVQSQPLHGLGVAFGLAVAFLILGQLLFLGVGNSNGIWIHESQPLMGILLGYYFVVPYRLMREYQKRWDYQKRHEVLVQVEELKTNFLSLVTHDLKTPVARVQGLAEVLVREAADRLTERDHSTVSQIINSTEELNRFITSILELTKVESKRLQIQLESKDINAVIEKSIDTFQIQARAKGIRITSQLEPLFPVHIDPSLISKVLNNLIDNAIKYSPMQSEIHIESKETGDWIEVSVSDQGIGLTPEEKDNLFTRFFRARNETTTRVPGTGLGLYLTKYFIEAHRGQVQVETEKGHGSTFKIRLPQNLDLTLSKRPKEKEKPYV